MTFYERSELFRKYPKTAVFDHSNYRLFERIHAVPGTSNNRGLTVYCGYTLLYQDNANDYIQDMFSGKISLNVLHRQTISRFPLS